MLIVLCMATIFGAIKGFAWQVASIASVIVSYFVAYRYRMDVAEMIQATPPWNQFLAMLILYVGTSFVIWVGFRLLSGTIDKVRLKEFDRHLGAGFGLVKGLIYCLLITMFALSLLGQNQQRAICQSRSGYYIASALDKGIGILPEEIHQVVGPYLTELDNKLKSGQDGPPPESLDWDPGQVGEQFAEQLPALSEAVQGLPGRLSEGLGDAGFTDSPALNPYGNGLRPGGAGSDPMSGGGAGSSYVFPPSGSGSGNMLRPTQQAQQPGAGWPR